MSAPILLDTDVLVDFLRGHSKAVSLVKAWSDRMILPAIVVAELYAGVKGEDERVALDAFVSLFRVVPVTQAIAQAGGLLKRDYGKSHGVGLADAIVAATAQAENAELKTLNTKHYPMFKGLRPAYLKA
ncbi:MAG TPA: type II toxin-antitoxin system VapC family toxin [Kiritimatiellia bacterium]|nr:type II toxin-antitoxin system VapC family toxin [Kiritimatiellia bacterium]HRU71766.1 type II toxin-antitoxin system VapC family toxin [Kiritimatiellia bacterium]